MGRFRGPIVHSTFPGALILPILCPTGCTLATMCITTLVGYQWLELPWFRGRAQNPGTACQARPAGGASSRVTVPSISPYGRSAA